MSKAPNLNLERVTSDVNETSAAFEGNSYSMVMKRENDYQALTMADVVVSDAKEKLGKFLK